jgi:hypothetical protein
MHRLAIFALALLLAVSAAVLPPGHPTRAQSVCFQETGFCISNPAFLEYFNLRGGVRILGYPISRQFVLEGFPVQFFQRVVLQQQPDNRVARLNILDPNVLPLTRANGSVFPGPDPALAATAPQVGTPDYAERVVEFVQTVAPNTWNGLPVGFQALFESTVPTELVFPGVTNPDPALVTLLNMEIWGVPTSQPAYDPTNPGFVYQRFQRGIMHFRAAVPVTEGVLVGDYLKSVITGQDLPPDLAEDTAASRYRYQWQPGAPAWVARPAELPNTDLTNAFVPELPGVVAPPPASQPTPTSSGGGGPAAPAVTPTVTSTPTPADLAPSVTIQVDDNRIDPGEQIRVTVIASDDQGLDWIQWEGVEDENGLRNETGNENGNDNEDNSVDDPELTIRMYDCEGQRQCANVWTAQPTVSGDYLLRGRARDTAGQRSAWVTVELRIRAGSPPNPTNTPVPTSTPLPTSTPVPTATPTPTIPTATPTP